MGNYKPVWHSLDPVWAVINVPGWSWAIKDPYAWLELLTAFINLFAWPGAIKNLLGA